MEGVDWWGLFKIICYILPSAILLSVCFLKKFRVGVSVRAYRPNPKFHGVWRDGLLPSSLLLTGCHRLAALFVSELRTSGKPGHERPLHPKRVKKSKLNGTDNLWKNSCRQLRAFDIVSSYGRRPRDPRAWHTHLPLPAALSPTAR